MRCHPPNPSRILTFSADITLCKPHTTVHHPHLPKTTALIRHRSPPAVNRNLARHFPDHRSYQKLVTDPLSTLNSRNLNFRWRHRNRFPYNHHHRVPS
ncbi:hypothetical protein Hanom_Chr06g00519741 [Helianthus anomalus]